MCSFIAFVSRTECQASRISLCRHADDLSTISTAVAEMSNTILLVFSVTPFKIDQNKKSKPFNRLSPESRNRKKVDIQRLSPRFRSQQFFLWKIWGDTFSQNL